MRQNQRNHVPLLLCCLGMLLAGCTQTGQLDDGNGSGRRALGITSLWAPAPGTAHTRADITQLPLNAEIGFYMKENAAALYIPMRNSPGSYQGTPKMWRPDTDVWLNSVEAEVAVCYPFDVTKYIGTPQGLALTAGLRHYPTGGERDVWCASFKASSHTKDIELILKHVYAGFVITFVKHPTDEYTGKAELTNVKLTGGGIYGDANYEPVDKVYDYGAEGVSVPFSPALTIEKEAEATPVEVDLLLIPYPRLTDDLTLTATVDGKEMAVKIPKDKLAGTLAAGNRYTLTVTLLPTKLELATLKTTGWDDSHAGLTGDASYPLPSEEEEEEIDIELEFAPGNVIAINDGYGNFSYAFASEQGYCGSGSERGDYFTWNTLEPAYWSQANISYWDDNRDPCRQIGTEWRTPTQADFQRLIDYRKSFWGTWEFADGSTVNGIYFGTKSQPAPADQDTYLFLPAGGQFNGTAYPYYNDMAFYWTRTEYGYGNSRSIFFIAQDGSLPDVKNNMDNTFGMPLRCVKDTPSTKTSKQ